MSVSAILAEVKDLHTNSAEEYIRTWFFEGHVMVVVNYINTICTREDISAEVPTLAALYHDIARVHGINDDPELMNQSLTMAREGMTRHNYSSAVIEHVCHIISIHSCKGEQPSTPEAKAMVTADGLAHMMTDFYFVLPFNGWLKAAKTVEAWKKWAAEKIERDFNRKILFAADKEMARPRYQALKLIMAPIPQP